MSHSCDTRFVGLSGQTLIGTGALIRASYARAPRRVPAPVKTRQTKDPHTFPGGIDRSLLWRAALVQTLAVAALFAVLALTLPHSFFEDWGVVVGPAGWIAASLVTMRVLSIPLRTVALASAVAGALAALLGAAVEHAVSLPVAVAAFALLCAARRSRAVTR